MSEPHEIVDFWLNEVGEGRWFDDDPALDATIRERFEADWHAVMSGANGVWRNGPRRMLGYLILTDQLSRNMFRGTARAYASDPLAQAATYLALDHGWDMVTPEPARQLFYMPLEHSECLSDQERAVRLILTRRTNAEGYLLHARAHREVIRHFGRFPFRNAHLGRASTAAEQAFMDKGGYRLALAAVQAA
jgi:uncharacterized protein (DUF924 family)